MKDSLSIFSFVMILCSIFNVLGMALGIKPPNPYIWLGSWFAVAFGLAIWMAVYAA